MIFFWFIFLVLFLSFFYIALLGDDPPLVRAGVSILSVFFFIGLLMLTKTMGIDTGHLRSVNARLNVKMTEVAFRSEKAGYICFLDAEGNEYTYYLDSGTLYREESETTRTTWQEEVKP